MNRLEFHLLDTLMATQEMPRLLPVIRQRSDLWPKESKSDGSTVGPISAQRPRNVVDVGRLATEKLTVWGLTGQRCVLIAAQREI